MPLADSRLATFFRRTREVFGAPRLASERDDEMAFHVEMETEKNIRRGMTAEAARRAATLSFGGRDRFREEVREARGFVAVEDLVRDARIAWRRIRRAPAFAAGVIATVGIGVGAAVGIGGIVYRVLLSDLPYVEPDRLVRVSLITPGNAVAGDLHSNATYAHLATAKSFDGFAAFYTNDGVTITDDEPLRVTAAMVTPGLFSLLGVRPVLGSLFAPSDTAFGGRIPILITEALWEQRYARDPRIIGRQIAINHGARRITGVLPRSFDFPNPEVDVWYAASLDLSSPSLDDRFYEVIARLKQGTALETATAELNALLPTIPARFQRITPAQLRASSPRVSLERLKDWTVAGVRGQLVLLGVMVAVVLLIATTNVVNLFLLRTERASHETAVALSLGASSSGIARRFVTEAVVLSAIAAIPAISIASLVLTTRLGFASKDIPRLHEVRFGPAEAATVVVAALILGVMVGFAAFARAMSDGVGIADRLLSAGRATATPGWRRTQRLLVTTQIAFALVLLVSAALLARSFDNLRRTPLGFDARNTLSFEVSLPYTPYASTAAASAFHARLMDELRALPGAGVRGVGITATLPLVNRGAPMSMVVERADGGRVEPVSARASFASADYFAVMGIPLTAGRSFQAGDIAREAPAVVLSATVARQMFGDESPVGRRIRHVETRRARLYEVVGVAGDVPGVRIEDGPAPTLYFPVLRDGDRLRADSFPLPIVPRGGQYVIRADAPPSAASIRAVLQKLDGRVPPMQIQPLTAYVDAALARVRLTMLLLGVASAGALLLGVIGVYTVVAYAAAGRVREYGVRLALGATPLHVAASVWRDAATMAGMGLGLGLVLAAIGTRVLRSLLFQVSPTSVAEFAIAIVVVAIVTLLATTLPARRAARTDPAVVLRGE